MEEESSFLSITECSAILEHWQMFVKDDSPTSLSSLEKVCLEIKDLKSSAIARRKNLNDITKAFRAKTKEEQILVMTDILKPYQDEIDLLSKRAKYAEGAFTSLFKALNETPNPCVAIESLLHLVTAGSVHSIEIERLKAELSQYEEEFQQLKNQDITIRRLEDQLAEFKDQIEDKVTEEVNARVLEVEAQAENRINEVKELQRNAEKRLAAALESMKQAQQSADRAQTQLFEMSTQVEKRVSSLQSENSILAEGTSRQAIRIAELEAECAALRRTSEQMMSMSQHSLASQSGDVTNDTMTLQLMVNDLREELHKQEDLLRSEKQRLEGQLRELTSQLAKEKESATKARVELAERPTREDYISLRRQLKSLQRIAFNVQDDESEEKDSQWDPENTNADKNQLEALLSMRMKSLESELTETRRELSESRHSENAAKDLVGTLKKSLENSTNLIIRLEADLEGKSAAFENKQKQHKSGPVELAELLGVSEDKKVGSSSSSGSGTGAAGASGGDTSNASHMVNILQTQRDRYKEKLTLAESNLLKLQQKVDAAESAKTQLEADNLALYSKIRFLQSYTSGGVNNYGGNASVKNYISPKPMKIARKPANLAPKKLHFDSMEEGRSHDDDDDFDLQVSNVEGKYHQLYEQRMNPFAEFSYHEKQRKLQELTVADRIVLNTTMAIVSNQMGRSFLLGYLASLHVLVFFILYYLTHNVHHGCDPNLDNKHHHAAEAAAAGVVLH